MILVFQPESSASSAKRPRVLPERNTAEYLEHRKRNNISVQKSRAKRKEQEQKLRDRVITQINLNTVLRARLTELEGELAKYQTLNSLSETEDDSSPNGSI